MGNIEHDDELTPLRVRYRGRSYKLDRLPDRLDHPQGVEVVSADQLRGAVEAAEKATASAERLADAIVAISDALPNVNRVRPILASLDSGGQ